MSARPRLAITLFAALLVAGCHSGPVSTPPPVPSSPHDAAIAANKAFLDQKIYDPWVLTSSGADKGVPLYISTGREGWVYRGNGLSPELYQAGVYKDGQLREIPYHVGSFSGSLRSQQPVMLNLQTGTWGQGKPEIVSAYGEPNPHWPRLWQTSDIVIDGDPQAQQVTHANLFYLLSSTFPGSAFSVPPMGLSSSVYGGHIFWDADVWMLPALLVQHPEYAKPVVDYRYKLLAQAERNARAHGFQGAEFPWESADTGAEVAPAEFARERHITADVAFAAWQYYLWTGDRNYLRAEGGPLLQATARYWASRVAEGADGKYHIKGVLSPDETAGLVDDDAYTNAVVQYNLRAAGAAAVALGERADPRWGRIADGLFFARDGARGIIAENSSPMTDRFNAKQADALLLLHPLGVKLDGDEERRMLDFYAAHTMSNGPAMTGSIESVVAAKLGRGRQSLDLFHDSYRPFIRAPWDAFAEKRTTNTVYFLTGMAGCVQSVLYGFAGLNAVSPWQRGAGKKIAGDGDGALFCDPHLPPGWNKLVVKGVHFRGRVLDIEITPGNKLAVRVPADAR